MEKVVCHGGEVEEERDGVYEDQGRDPRGDGGGVEEVGCEDCPVGVSDEGKLVYRVGVQDLRHLMAEFFAGEWEVADARAHGLKVFQVKSSSFWSKRK